MAHQGHDGKKKHRQGMPACLREILRASFWKAAHREFNAFEKGRPRWTLPSCWHIGLFMALQPPSAIQERFDGAWACVTALFPKRKRCGATPAGWSLAMCDFPPAFFQRVIRELQRQLEAENIGVARVGRLQAYALDGSIQNIPRTQEHEAAYGISTKGTAHGAGFPQRQVVAAVAMGKNVLWDWECGGALVGEREQSLKIMARLPASALGVFDAGFLGYEWARTIIELQRNFLVRVGANVRLWVDELNATLSAEWHDGEVWLWPDKRRAQAPLVLRLIRIECAVAGRAKKNEMWLVTNVLDEAKLTRAEAAELYRKRWRASECTFRDWKKTLGASKLQSRTPAVAEREEEFGLCALQLLQVTTILARKQSRKKRRRGRARNVSVAKAQRVWRKAARALAAGKSTRWFKKEMIACVVDEYRRRKPKVRRAWPERKAHEGPKAPHLLKLEKPLKACGEEKLREARAKAS
jgi:hypothetical protein